MMAYQSNKQTNKYTEKKMILIIIITHNVGSILEIEAHTILQDFEIQTDHLISARQPDLMIVYKKRTCRNSGVCCPSWQQGKNEWRKKER